MECQKWYRALPQVTTNVKNNSEYFNERYYKKALLRMNSILQRYEINPYEALFEQLPRALDSENDFGKCIIKLNKVKIKLQEYYNWIVQKASYETKVVFEDCEDSLYHILTNWYDNQSEVAKGTINDGEVASFMKVISSIRKVDGSSISSDFNIVDNVVKAVTGTHIDYWNDNSLEQYIKQLIEVKEKIECIKV